MDTEPDCVPRTQGGSASLCKRRCLYKSLKYLRNNTAAAAVKRHEGVLIGSEVFVLNYKYKNKCLNLSLGLN